MKTQTMLIALALAIPAGLVSAQAPEGAPPGPPREGAPREANRPRGDRPEGGPNQRDRAEVRRDGDRPEGGPRQPGRPEGGSEQGGRPPVPPLIASLDKNGDGQITEDEIAHAADALRKLDKNADGKLTMDELMPRLPRDGRPMAGSLRSRGAAVRVMERERGKPGPGMANAPVRRAVPAMEKGRGRLTGRETADRALTATVSVMGSAALEATVPVMADHNPGGTVHLAAIGLKVANRVRKAALPAGPLRRAKSG